jgi:cation diffusion facilitator family transporter
VFGTLAIVVTVISIVGKEALAQYSFYIGRKTGSGAVSADGWHHRSDALSSLIILIGIFLGRYFWWIDGVLGIIVALMILYTAIMIMKNTSNSLLGEKPELELINRIRDICQKKVGYEIHPHHVHLHNYINHKELTLHIYLPDQMTITMAHEISSSIEKEIEQLLQIETTIHVEPLSILPFDNDKNE